MVINVLHSEICFLSCLLQAAPAKALALDSGRQTVNKRVELRARYSATEDILRYPGKSPNASRFMQSFLECPSTIDFKLLLQRLSHIPSLEIAVAVTGLLWRLASNEGTEAFLLSSGESR